MTIGNKTTIGSCSLCGGPVSVPTIWHGIYPPRPQCERCGALAAQSFGPVIPMEPPDGLSRPRATQSRLSFSECVKRHRHDCLLGDF